jgi:predicted ester cyclase
MSTETNKAIARRVFEEVFNAGNLPLIDTLAAPDVVIHYGGAGPVRGLDAYKRAFIGSQPAFPDMHFTIEAMIAEADQVVTRWTMRATHGGEYLGAAATGRQVTETGISIYRIGEGKIIEGWVQSDDLGVMQQLGILSVPAHAG